MRAVLRSVAAVFAGFVVASVLMMIFESLNGRFLHPDLAEAAEGMTDREAIRALLAAAPITAFLVVLFGWVLGAFAGGWTVGRIAGRGPVRHGLVLGLILTLAGVANNLMIPPPVWFWCVSLFVFLPAAYAGARLAPKRAAWQAR